MGCNKACICHGQRQAFSTDVVQAPINPSDINTIQGRYPLGQPLPGVPGHEGVFEVRQVGGQVRAAQGRSMSCLNFLIKLACVLLLE